MRFIPKIWIALAAAALLHGAVFAASFTASLDRDTIMLGEQATLSLTFEGGQSNKVPAPFVPALEFAQIGNSQSFSIVNGAMSSTVNVSFSVTARQAGKFTIPMLTADMGGQRLSTAPLTLTVTTASAPSTAAVNSGNEVAFLKFEFPKNKIFVGEPKVARLELYLRDDVQNFGNFQLTSSPTDGLSSGKATELQGMRRRVQIGSRVYTVIPISMPLTAVRT